MEGSNHDSLLIPTSTQATRSSLEIAELTGKKHRNVMADIRSMLRVLKLLSEVEGGMLNFQHTHRNPQNGQTYPIFRLPKRECLILVSGYSVELRAAIIDRWAELEAKAAGPTLPNFANPAEAARACTKRYEGQQRALAQVVAFATHPRRA